MVLFRPYSNLIFAAAAAMLAMPCSHGASLEKGSPAPLIKGIDIAGQPFDLDAVLTADHPPALCIALLFKVGSGEELADKLRRLDEKYGRELLQVVALGVEADRAELQAFAERMGIRYHILDSASLEDSAWLDEVSTLPMTLFVQCDASRRIERVIAGGGDTRAQLLREIAENLYQQRRSETLAVADLAIEAGEDEASARELKGFYLSDTGRLDEAAQEFNAIASDTGLAQLALARGDYNEAATLAAKSDDPFAAALAGEAKLREGKPDAAAEVLGEASVGELPAWKSSRLLTAQARAAQEQGQDAAALAKYEQAIAIDPYNVTALSNESVVHQKAGGAEDLSKAREALEQAAGVREDPVVEAMLRQVIAKQEQATDVQRNARVREQIAALKERYAALKASGAADADSWTSKKMVMALLQGGGQWAYFEQAGAPIAIQRDLESALAASGKTGIVEREQIEALLQELDLGSSELASADTQRTLGRVLSAQYLAFLDFAQVGAAKRLYLRLVDTETTAIAFQQSFPVDDADPLAVVQPATDAVTQFLAGRELHGLVEEAGAEGEVVINLGTSHGVREGMAFNVLADSRPIAKLKVTLADESISVCETTHKRDGSVVEKDQKVKSSAQ